MYIFEFKLKLVVYLSNQTEREMRKYGVIRVIVCIMLLGLACACGRKGVDVPELLHADKLMEEHPDSALMILQGLTGTEKFSPESKAFYCLLLTEAKDKTFAIHESDSLIHIAVDYYEHSNDLLHKAKAWFYWGRVSQDLLRTQKALNCYLKALPYAAKGRHYKLMGLTCNFAGNVYRKLGVYDKALQYFERACCNFELAKDSKNLPYGIRNVGRAFLLLEKYDSTFIYYNKALELAERDSFLETKATILNDIGTAYRTLGDYELAIKYIYSSIPLKKPKERYSSYLSLGRLYFELNRLDSAYNYLSLAEQSPSVYVKEGVYRYQYKWNVATENYKKAVDYNQKYQIVKNLVDEANQKEKILALTYQYEQREMEAQLEQRATLERLIYLCLIFVLLAITILGFYMYIHYRWSNEQVLRLKEKRIQQEKELRLQSLEQIENNRKIIESNKQKLISKEIDLQIAQRALLVYNTNLLKAENELIALKRADLDFRNKLFSQTELYAQIRCAGVDTRKKDIPCKPFHMKDFPSLMKKLNELYDDFAIRLKKTYPQLKERDIEVCCLVKAGAKTGNIASIISMTPNAVTKKKRQILEKMEMVDENLTLDIFVMSF